MCNIDMCHRCRGCSIEVRRRQFCSLRKIHSGVSLYPITSVVLSVGVVWLYFGAIANVNMLYVCILSYFPG